MSLNKVIILMFISFFVPEALAVGDTFHINPGDTSEKWVLNTFSNSEQLVSILDGIKSIINSSNFKLAMVTMSVAALFYMVFRVSKEGFSKSFMSFLVAIIIINYLTNSKIDLVIIDEKTNSPNIVVNGTPAIVTAPFVLSNFITTSLTGLFNPILSVNGQPYENYSIYKKGFGFINNVIDGSSKTEVTNPFLRKTLNEYSAVCVNSAISRNDINFNDLVISSDLINDVYAKSKSNSQLVRVWNISIGAEDFVTCSDAFTNYIEPAFSNPDILDGLLFSATKNLTLNSNVSILPTTAITDAWTLMGNTAPNPTNIAVQHGLANALKADIQTISGISGVDQFNLSTQIEQAKDQFLLSRYINSVITVDNTIYVYQFAMLLVIALAPLVILLSLVKASFKPLGSYFAFALFISFIPLALEIGNWSIISNLYGSELQTYLGTGNGALSINAVTVANEDLMSKMSSAAFIVMAIPGFLWMLIKSDALSMDNFLQGSQASEGGSAADSAVKNNLDYNNVRTNNVSSNKIDNVHQKSTGISPSSVAAGAGVGAVIQNAGQGYEGQLNGKALTQDHQVQLSEENAKTTQYIKASSEQLAKAKAVSDSKMIQTAKTLSKKAGESFQNALKSGDTKQISQAFANLKGLSQVISVAAMDGTSKEETLASVAAVTGAFKPFDKDTAQKAEKEVLKKAAKLSGMDENAAEALATKIKAGDAGALTQLNETMAGKALSESLDDIDNNGKLTDTQKNRAKKNLNLAYAGKLSDSRMKNFIANALAKGDESSLKVLLGSEKGQKIFTEAMVLSKGANGTVDKEKLKEWTNKNISGKTKALKKAGALLGKVVGSSTAFADIKGSYSNKENKTKTKQAIEQVSKDLKFTDTEQSVDSLSSAKEYSNTLTAQKELLDSTGITDVNSVVDSLTDTQNSTKTSSLAYSNQEKINESSSKKIGLNISMTQAKKDLKNITAINSKLNKELNDNKFSGEVESQTNEVEGKINKQDEKLTKEQKAADKKQTQAEKDAQNLLDKKGNPKFETIEQDAEAGRTGTDEEINAKKTQNKNNSLGLKTEALETAKTQLNVMGQMWKDVSLQKGISNLMEGVPFMPADVADKSSKSLTDFLNASGTLGMDEGSVKIFKTAVEKGFTDGDGVSGKMLFDKNGGIQFFQTDKDGNFIKDANGMAQELIVDGDKGFKFIEKTPEQIEQAKQAQAALKEEGYKSFSEKLSAPAKTTKAEFTPLDKDAAGKAQAMTLQTQEGEKINVKQVGTAQDEGSGQVYQVYQNENNKDELYKFNTDNYKLEKLNSGMQQLADSDLNKDEKSFEAVDSASQNPKAITTEDGKQEDAVLVGKLGEQDVYSTKDGLYVGSEESNFSKLNDEGSSQLQNIQNQLTKPTGESVGNVSSTTTAPDKRDWNIETEGAVLNISGQQVEATNDFNSQGRQVFVNNDGQEFIMDSNFNLEAVNNEEIKESVIN